VRKKSKRKAKRRGKMGKMGKMGKTKRAKPTGTGKKGPKRPDVDIDIGCCAICTKSDKSTPIQDRKRRRKSGKDELSS